MSSVHHRWHLHAKFSLLGSSQLEANVDCHYQWHPYTKPSVSNFSAATPLVCLLACDKAMPVTTLSKFGICNFEGRRGPVADHVGSVYKGHADRF
eukprot:3564037-Amphidinium_carterae.1